MLLNAGLKNFTLYPSHNLKGGLMFGLHGFIMSSIQEMSHSEYVKYPIKIRVTGSLKF